MSSDLRMVVYSAFLSWVMLLTASLIRARAWTWSGTLVAFGNRDNLPPLSPLAGRADRAAKNMLEGLVMFVAVIVAARLSGAPESKVEVGASMFFWARLVYFPTYLLGIKYVRTAVWAVGVAGLFRIALAGL